MKDFTYEELSEITREIVRQVQEGGSSRIPPELRELFATGAMAMVATLAAEVVRRRAGLDPCQTMRDFGLPEQYVARVDPNELGLTPRETVQEEQLQ